MANENFKTYILKEHERKMKMGTLAGRELHGPSNMKEIEEFQCDKYYN